MQPNNAPAAEAETEELDDSVLVAKCQQGDAQAFGELVSKYRGKMYAIIYNMVGNEQDAWDIAQDALLKAWKSIARFRGQSSFYTWLYRITMNVTIDSIRKKKIESGVELDDSIGLTHIAPGSRTTPQTEPLPDAKMNDREIRQRIDGALAQLSAEHRAVIVMKEIEGMQYNEIADALDCSIGTVMSRLFYARKKLQTLLKDVYETL